MEQDLLRHLSAKENILQLHLMFYLKHCVLQFFHLLKIAAIFLSSLQVIYLLRKIHIH